MYKNLFLTRKRTDHVKYFILARIEKGEAREDNKTPGAVPHHFIGNYH